MDSIKNIDFTKKQLSLLKETDFLLTKINIIEKVNSLFVKTKKELLQATKKSNFNFPNKLELKKCKISKGEYYRGLPYLVLDCPAHFSDKNIFTFRTMFWWGNFFSSTLHLQGESLEKYRNYLVTNLDNLLNKEIYICINTTPWEYHYEKDNYVLLDNSHKPFITKCNFLKLSKKIELENWYLLTDFSKEFLELLLTNLK
ncbi:MAG: hypothetical protein COW08_03430 [Ignavibacteriales bacterium CG12_big_fil_rev_8_21_14_0_65_30_8]|nr:MAG: hypothetical protein COW08_03430 [Ignavibacteriales bacterium CG12_big_fil_rev_8_21_14_0_65_30_8]